LKEQTWKVSAEGDLPGLFQKSFGSIRKKRDRNSPASQEPLIPPRANLCHNTRWSGKRIDRYSDGCFRSRFAVRNSIHLGEDIRSEKGFTALLAYLGGNVFEDENLLAPAMDMLNALRRNSASAKVTRRHFNFPFSSASQSIRLDWGGTP
jgi:hypothetical protein